MRLKCRTISWRCCFSRNLILTKQKQSVMKVKWMFLGDFFQFPHRDDTWSLVFDLEIYGVANEWFFFVIFFTLSVENIAVQYDQHVIKNGIPNMTVWNYAILFFFLGNTNLYERLSIISETSSDYILSVCFQMRCLSSFQGSFLASTGQCEESNVRCPCVIV